MVFSFLFFQHQKKGRWRYKVVLLKKWPWQSPLFWSSTYAGMVWNLNSKPKRWQIRKLEESVRQQCNQEDIAANKSWCWCYEPAHLYSKWRWRRFLVNMLGAIGVITKFGEPSSPRCVLNSLSFSLSFKIVDTPRWAPSHFCCNTNPTMIDCTLNLPVIQNLSLSPLKRGV